jgi:hypothetical protein
VGRVERRACLLAGEVGVLANRVDAGPAKRLRLGELLLEGRDLQVPGKAELVGI